MLHFFLTYYHLQTRYRNIYKTVILLNQLLIYHKCYGTFTKYTFFFSCIYFYATFTLQVNLNLYTCKFYSFKRLF